MRANAERDPPSGMYVVPSVECCWSNRENNEAKMQNLLKFARMPNSPTDLSH